MAVAEAERVMLEIADAAASAYERDPFTVLTKLQLQNAEIILIVLLSFVQRHASTEHSMEEIVSAKQNDYIGIIQNILSFQPNAK